MSSENTLPSIASLSGPTTLPPIVENKPSNISLYLPSIFNDIERRTSLPASFTSKRKLPVYQLPFHSSMHTVYRRDSSASASDSDGEPSAVFSRNSFSDTSTPPHYRITTTPTPNTNPNDSARPPTPKISPSSPIHIHTGDSSLLLSSRRGVPRSGLRHSCKYPDCGWSFKRFEHLKRHMMTHSGEKPFVCEFPGCGKSFGRSDNFSAHARIHNTNPPSENGESNAVDSEFASAQEKKRPRSNSSEEASVQVEKKQRPSHSPPPAEDTQSPSKSYSIKMLLNEDVSANNRPEDPTDDERNAAAMCLASLPFAAQRDLIGLTLATNNNFPLSPTSSTTLTSPSSPVGSPTNDYTGPFTFLERTAPVQQRRSLPMDFYPSRNGTGAATSTLHIENNQEFKAPSRPSLPTNSRTPKSAPSNASEEFDSSKPHVCTHPSGCNRRFKRREHLRRHSRTHTDEKPFVCPTCLKSFSRSDNLNQHARTHGVRTGSVSSTTNSTATNFPSSTLQRSSSSPSHAPHPPVGTFDANPAS